MIDPTPQARELIRAIEKLSPKITRSGDRLTIEYPDGKKAEYRKATTPKLSSVRYRFR